MCDRCGKSFPSMAPYTLGSPWSSLNARDPNLTLCPSCFYGMLAVCWLYLGRKLPDAIVREVNKP